MLSEVHDGCLGPTGLLLIPHKHVLIDGKLCMDAIDLCYIDTNIQASLVKSEKSTGCHVSHTHYNKPYFKYLVSKY